MVLPSACLQSDPCPYHQNGEFVLPPAMEWFYKPHHPEYVGARRKTASDQAMEFIYPGSGTVLYLPRQLSGEVEGVVFRVAHHSSDATLWWHLDQSFVGETRFIHELRLAPSVGRHTLTVVDGDGNSASIVFTVAE
jgi:penicillin-binding protein 1C